jgi:DNA-binding NarL/FixJ family response regulator
VTGPAGIGLSEIRRPGYRARHQLEFPKLPAAARKLIAAYLRRPAPDYPIRDIADLTEREREVLRLVGLGHSNQEICTTLYISMATTKTHIGRLLAKLDARDRAQLVIAAYQSGLAC